MKICRLLLFVAALAPGLPAAEPAKVFEASLKEMEGEIVPLVEAMPAAEFGFAPTSGAFEGVRTFGLQARHIAFVMDEIASAVLGERNPSASAANENGPDDLKTKDQIVKYLKDAFAYAHRAVASLTAGNLLEPTADPFNPKAQRTRMDSISILLWHSYDHYGQMVEYARMNGVIPPASRPRNK